MVGIDIMPVNECRREDRCLRYLDKILNESEFVKLDFLILDQQLSFAWTLKEAAFKYISTKNDEPFIPKEIRIKQIFKNEDQPILDFSKRIDSNDFKQAHYFRVILDTPIGNLSGLVLMTDQFTLAVVSKTFRHFANIFWAIKVVPFNNHKSHSSLVRKLAIQHYVQDKKDIKPEELEFRQDKKGLPFLLQNGLKTETTFSFSHQNYFISYAIYRHDLLEVS